MSVSPLMVWRWVEGRAARSTGNQAAMSMRSPQGSRFHSDGGSE